MKTYCVTVTDGIEIRTTHTDWRPAENDRLIIDGKTWRVIYWI